MNWNFLKMNPGYLPYFTKVGILFALYCITGKLGLMMDAVSGFATLVWPPTGISLAALLVFGYQLWPGITLGAFLLNLLSGAPLLVACGMAIGNTLEALLATYWLQRFAGFHNSLERLQDVLGLVVLASLLSTMVSATIGVSSLWLAGVVSLTSYGLTWRAWWVGDMLGNLAVAPLLLSWVTRPHIRTQSQKIPEAGMLALCLLVAGLVVFWGLFSTEHKDLALTYLVFPPLIWAALRFGQRGAATATFAMSFLAIWGTARGFGPFAKGSVSESLFFLQLFMGVLAVTAMILAAVVAERAHSEQVAQESGERLRLVVEAAPNAMVMVDQVGRIVLVNSQAEELFRYPREELMGQSVDLLVPGPMRAKHPDYRSSFFSKPAARPMGAGRDLCGLRKDGGTVAVEIGLNPLTTNEGTFVLASIIDISERKRAEEQIRASLKEKEILLKEIHHRVKNNLQIISSMLNLQAKSIKDSRASEMFRESQNRVRSIALIHEKLYESKNLSDLDFTDHIRSLVSYLFRSYGAHPDRIVPRVRVKDGYLGMDTVIPCGLIINELVSNSLKYAFPEGKGEISIELLRDNDDRFTLVVSDDGVGFPKDLDFRNTETLGLQLVNTLTDQLKGSIELRSRAGTKFAITFAAPGRKKERKDNDPSADIGC